MITKRTNRFCLCKNIYSAPELYTWAQIKEVMQSPQVDNICKQIAELDPNAADYQQQKDKLKKRLPVITPHACEFENNKRHSDYAWWNGMVCLEYDHLTKVEIEAIMNIRLNYAVKLAGMSCSSTGVFFIIEVPQAEYSALKGTLIAIHEEICQKISDKSGLDIKEKVDIRIDLARTRFLVPYDYIWLDAIEDFDSYTERQGPYLSMVADIVDRCKNFDPYIPEGKRHNTYKDYVVQLKQITNNKHLILKHLPDLGLSEEERLGLINWSDTHIETKPQKVETPNFKMQPIDAEALPCPIKKLPKLIQTLVKPQLPRSWQTAATMCLLPALSTAAGNLSLSDGKPLSFQVALYGVYGAGKTEFSAKPATFIQEYIGKNDNNYRKAIARSEKIMMDSAELQCPKILPFTNTSTTQLQKYIRYAPNTTVMTYEGDLSSKLSGKESAFLNIKNILRKGFDGEIDMADYSTENSFRGAVHVRLSALVVGTPTTIFNYFDPQSTSEGNARRIIFVEHEQIRKIIEPITYTDEEEQYIFQEIEYLQSIEHRTVFHKIVEEQANKWRDDKQKQAGQDDILYNAAHTPAKMFRRAAYLMWALYHFKEEEIMNCCAFGKWVAEYQYRQYINQTYTDQQKDMQAWNKRKSPSTQTLLKQFNDKMLEELPNTFTMQDVFNYRLQHNYEHDIKSQAVVSRWKNQGLVAPSKNKTWVKI